MKIEVKKGATSKILHIFILDSSKTDGSGLTGLAYNSAGLTAYYIRPGQATATAITLATITTIGTYAAGGFKEIDATNLPGWYEFDPPDACFATGADSCGLHLKGAANMAPLPIEVALVDNTAKDVFDRLGVPAGTSIAADLLTIDNFVDELESRLTATRAGYLDNLNGHVPQTGDSYAIVNHGTYGNSALRTRGDAAWTTATGFSTHTAADVWAVATRDITGGTVDNCTTNTDMRGTDGAYTGTPPTTAQIADAVWDEIQSGHTTAGTFGKYLDTEVSGVGSSLTQQQVRDAMKLAPTAGAPGAGSVDEHLDDILADTADLQTNQGNWLTATGFSTHSAADVWTATTRALTDKVGFALSAAGVDAIHDEVVEGSLTFRQIKRVEFAALAGKTNGAGTATMNFRDNADAKNRIAATLDTNGNRTAVTLDGT